MSVVSAANRAVSEDKDYCFHCGEIIPSSVDISVTIDNVERHMCCQGCCAVARAISQFGLADYYRFRSVLPPRPDESAPEETCALDIYDDPGFQKDFAVSLDSNIREASLIMEGMVCPACAWLNETHLATLPGVVKAVINYTSGKALIQWDESRIRLSEILENIYKLGYKAYPYKPGKRQELRDREKKYLLLRLGLAGLLGMQVMMIAIALYAGEWQWMEEGHRYFLRWTSLILTTPIMVFSAQPFFTNSWRAIQNRRLEMDVAIALGISIAYTASLFSTIKGSGTVYFDSVAMLVFFLLIGRYLEFNARNKASTHLDKLEKIIPSVVTRLEKFPFEYSEQIVPVNQVHINDIVLVKAGETVPVDGDIITGDTSIDESIITGESDPVVRKQGDRICSGSTNIDSPIQVKVTATGSNTTFSRICSLIENAQSEKPAVALLVDRVASWFIGSVLLIAAGAAWYWWNTDTALWIPVTIATLVVTCPCALSLATPVSITVATNRMLKLGVALIRSEALQTITGITHIGFDKTGTLTEGKLKINRIVSLADLPESRVLSIARALEVHSEHPIAKAFREFENSEIINPAIDIRNYPGEGISGTVDDRKYYIGTSEFIKKHLVPGNTDFPVPVEQYDRSIILADEDEILATFYLTDQIRPYTQDVIGFFNQRNICTMILSGDNQEAVSKLAGMTGVAKTFCRCKPAEKLSVIEQLQEQNAVVAMVGDGINDAPVLARADVSIAMGSGTDLTQLNADMVLLGSRLTNIIDIYLTANRCMKIIRQNIVWAIVYNLVALPAAVSGWVAPWMAALGMSASSLLVVLNSLRINKQIDY